MSLANLQQQLADHHSTRSLAESDGVSNTETPRCNYNRSKHLSAGAESPVSKSPSYACAPARAREIERGKTDSSDSRDSATVPEPAVILRHCRCADCLNFSRVGGEYFCSEYIGGTAIVWATGRRSCDPPPDTWHYCAGYRGPQISRDVWAWPKVAPRSRQVGAGSNISVESERDATFPAGTDTGEPVQRHDICRI